MTRRLPSLNAKQVIRALERAGFFIERSSGSHHFLVHRTDPRRRVTVAGKEIRLTPIEYKLLTALVRHAGKVVTHHQLLQDVWGPAHTDQAHYVRVYMAHLRQKVEAEPARPRYLLTEPGVGYRLAVD